MEYSLFVSYTTFLYIVLGCVGCAPKTTSEDLEFSYEEYCERYALRNFDPIGVKSISTKGYSPRDGYDVWWKMEISKEDWLGILKQIGLGDPKPYSPDSQEKGAFGIPYSWPESDIPFPDWWIPADDFGTLIITSQEQKKKGKRAKGWYWLYDEPTSTAIAWHWNTQYWRFPPSKTPLNLKNDIRKSGQDFIKR